MESATHPNTFAGIESGGLPATLFYIRHLEAENNRLWTEISTMRDSLHIVAQGTVSEITKTLSKASTTFEALERRLSSIVPTPFVAGIEKQENLRKRPVTPGSEL